MSSSTTGRRSLRAIPILLKQLDLKGAIITTDAMGTQTAIARQIRQAEEDYILTLKSNHPSLADDARHWFEENRQKIDTTEAKVTEVICEAGHHRIEKRQFWQVPVEQVFAPNRIKQWAGALLHKSKLRRVET